MAFATPADFEVRHGPLGEEGTARVEALLGDASALIELEVSGAEADWLGKEPEGNPPAAVVAICIQVAYRAWANPDSVAREELGEVARTYRGTDQADALWLTAGEARMLRKAVQGSSIQSLEVETPYSGDRSEPHPMDFLPFEAGS